jgi:hypothetical protein
MPSESVPTSGLWDCKIPQNLRLSLEIDVAPLIAISLVLCCAVLCL